MPSVKLLHEEARLLGRAQVGLGDELDERRAAAVVVDEALGGVGDAPFLAAHVHHLGGVLLHVDAQDADRNRVGAVFRAHGTRSERCVVGTLAGPRLGSVGRLHGREARGARGSRGEACRLGAAERAVRTLRGTLPRDLEVQMTVHAEGDGALRGLEVLGHIRIEVVLAVEHRVLLDLAVGGEAGLDDALDGLFVGNRQRARQAQAHGADVGVGLVVVAELAAAEHLGVERGELGVDLEADDGLPVLQDLGELLHLSSPPFPAHAGATGAAP